MSTIAYRFPATFAGIPLQIVTMSSDLGRDVIHWRPARGRGAQLQDRGQRPRVYDLQVVLVGTAAQVTAARDALLAVRADGTARTFVHPVDGPVVCRLSDLSEQISAGDVSYRINLTEDVPFALRRQREAAADRVTLQDVEASTELLDQAMEILAQGDPLLAAGLPSGADALEVAESWAASPPTAEQVEADLAPVRQDHASGRASLESVAGLEAYNVLVALVDVGGTLQRYAVEVQRQAPQVTELQLGVTMPLARVVAGFYGADTGARVLADVARLNGVRNPLRVPAGTVLRLPLYEEL